MANNFENKLFINDLQQHGDTKGLFTQAPDAHNAKEIGDSYRGEAARIKNSVDLSHFGQVEITGQNPSDGGMKTTMELSESGGAPRDKDPSRHEGEPSYETTQAIGENGDAPKHPSHPNEKHHPGEQREHTMALGENGSALKLELHAPIRHTAEDAIKGMPVDRGDHTAAIGESGHAVKEPNDLIEKPVADPRFSESITEALRNAVENSGIRIPGGSESQTMEVGENGSAPKPNDIPMHTLAVGEGGYAFKFSTNSSPVAFSEMLQNKETSS